jgi:uncharacterized protein YkwD
VCVAPRARTPSRFKLKQEQPELEATLGRRASLKAWERTADSTEVSVLDRNLLVEINAVRKAHALTPLKRSAPLAVAAAQHTAEMGKAGYFAHASLDHTQFWKRIERKYPSAGYRFWEVGENLLYVAPNVGAAEAMRLWMHSPEHRANLLNPMWREIGVATRHFNSAPGFYNDEPVTILTTDFGVRRKS